MFSKRLRWRGSLALVVAAIWACSEAELAPGEGLGREQGMGQGSNRRKREQGDDNSGGMKRKQSGDDSSREESTRQLLAELAQRERGKLFDEDIEAVFEANVQFAREQSARMHEQDPEDAQYADYLAEATLSFDRSPEHRQWLGQMDAEMGELFVPGTDAARASEVHDRLREVFNSRFAKYDAHVLRDFKLHWELLQRVKGQRLSDEQLVAFCFDEFADQFPPMTLGLDAGYLSVAGDVTIDTEGIGVFRVPNAVLLRLKLVKIATATLVTGLAEEYFHFFQKTLLGDERPSAIVLPEVQLFIRWAESEEGQAHIGSQLSPELADLLGPEQFGEHDEDLFFHDDQYLARTELDIVPMFGRLASGKEMHLVVRHLIMEVSTMPQHAGRWAYLDWVANHGGEWMGLSGKRLRDYVDRGIERHVRSDFGSGEGSN